MKSRQAERNKRHALFHTQKLDNKMYIYKQCTHGYRTTLRKENKKDYKGGPMWQSARAMKKYEANCFSSFNSSRNFLLGGVDK